MNDDTKVSGCGAVIVIVFVSLWFLLPIFGTGPCYSTGYRDGVIQKVSDKGYLFVTTEAELALPGYKIKGETGSNIFEFSVPSSSLRDELAQCGPDDLVRIHYRQYMWQAYVIGKTPYRVYKVEKVK